MRPTQALARLLGRTRMADPEAASEWELKHLQHIHMLRHYRRERRRPPNYDRYGLVKRRGPGAQGNQYDHLNRHGDL